MLYLSLLGDLEWIKENTVFISTHFSCFMGPYRNLNGAILILLLTIEYDFAVEC